MGLKKESFFSVNERRKTIFFPYFEGLLRLYVPGRRIHALTPKGYPCVLVDMDIYLFYA